MNRRSAEADRAMRTSQRLDKNAWRVEEQGRGPLITRQQAMDRSNAYSAAYPIELLARNPIEIDESALVRALTRRLGRVKATGHMFFLEDFPVQFREGAIPAQLALMGAVGLSAKRTDDITKALHQSWAFPAAAQVYDACGHMEMLTNMMSSPLSHQVRRKIISNGLLALLETTQVDLIYWIPTQQMLSPADIVERYSDPRELENPLYGFLNVRFFNISNSTGDMLMDTLGLNALGLTDFQLHYRGLDPDSVARFLFNLGAYAFEKGDVIDDGHTVDGVDKKGRWTCRHENSLVEPGRVVLDIDPGQPFAAGNRQ
jgi:hypothetical protein